jgi:hypothetical protein
MKILIVDGRLCYKILRHLNSEALANLPQRCRNIAYQVFTINISQMDRQVSIKIPSLVKEALREIDKRVLDELVNPNAYIPEDQKISIYNDFTQLKTVIQ